MTALLLAGMAGCAAAPFKTVDYALGAHQDAWLRHPVLGDPSFDTFERAPANPVVRGTEPFEWPVNGFLFEDPVSGHWYLYVGHYLRGYAFSTDQPSHCTVLRSTDRGGHWEPLGRALAQGNHLFTGEVSPLHSAPDVSVLHDKGKYHMVFDWASQNTTWENASNPPTEANSGAGYAWSDTPGGPFHPVANPVVTTRAQVPMLGKYRRMYASTLLRRAEDWLVLTLTDSGPFFGWALAGMTAPSPEGPWTEAKLLLHPERAAWHPPLLEFFPAFVHEGWVYAPATSVARNRNYQALFRAPLDRAMDPAAWELFQAGSIWHADPVEWETAGIWGQTFSGFVDAAGTFNVMFPSRDKNGCGTINLASRPWNRPFRERGFTLSGHGGPSITLLKHGMAMHSLKVDLTLHGTAEILWDYTGVPDPDRPASDAVPHPHALAGYTGLELGEKGWALRRVDKNGTAAVAASGNAPVAGDCALEMEWAEDKLTIQLNKTMVWTGALPAPAGVPGMILRENSHAKVTRFEVGGTRRPASLFWGWREGMLCAAQQSADWRVVDTPDSRCGSHIVPARAGLQLKWNIEGAGFKIWAPAGPDFGGAEVLVDGNPAGMLVCHEGKESPAAPRFAVENLPSGRHTIILNFGDSPVPAECLEVMMP